MRMANPKSANVTVVIFAALILQGKNAIYFFKITEICETFQDSNFCEIFF